MNRLRNGNRVDNEATKIRLNRPAAPAKCKVNNYGLARKSSLMGITQKRKTPSYEVCEEDHTTWIKAPGEIIGVENKYIEQLGMDIKNFFNPVFERLDGTLEPMAKESKMLANTSETKVRRVTGVVNKQTKLREQRQQPFKTIVTSYLEKEKQGEEKTKVNFQKPQAVFNQQQQEQKEQQQPMEKVAKRIPPPVPKRPPKLAGRPSILKAPTLVGRPPIPQASKIPERRPLRKWTPIQDLTQVQGATTKTSPATATEKLGDREWLNCRPQEQELDNKKSLSAETISIRPSQLERQSEELDDLTNSIRPPQLEAQSEALDALTPRLTNPAQSNAAVLDIVSNISSKTTLASRSSHSDQGRLRVLVKPTPVTQPPFELVNAADVYQVLEMQSGVDTAKGVMDILLAQINKNTTTDVGEASESDESENKKPNEKVDVPTPRTPAKHEKLSKLFNNQFVRPINKQEINYSPKKLSPPMSQALGGSKNTQKQKRQKEMRMSSRPKKHETLISENFAISYTARTDFEKRSNQDRKDTKVQLDDLSEYVDYALQQMENTQHTEQAQQVAAVVPVKVSRNPFLESRKSIESSSKELHYSRTTNEHLPSPKRACIVPAPKRERRFMLQTSDFMYPTPKDLRSIPLYDVGVTRDDNVTRDLVNCTLELYEHVHQLRNEVRRREQIEDLFAVGPYRRHKKDRSVGGRGGRLNRTSSESIREFFINTPMTFIYIFGIVAIFIIFLSYGQQPEPATFWEQLLMKIDKMLSLT
ncbi:inner centromere protein A [Scaptodrosophila lebanonensis]|uniref:Inner centromere protein A n=1 Tax=Drosophila lebanonensis TaxID=7225 RepID=A0A6J2TQ55_DROLE|nr:inner centromere protein A [Scaptodrosophila lebanonensis]